MDKVKHREEFLLFDKYLSGNTEAGEELFSSIYPVVRKYVFSQTKNDSYLNESDKEDIIADAMMRAIDKQYLFNGSSKFASFVIGFARNIILEVRKKTAQQASKVVSIDEVINLENIDIFNNPLYVVIEKERFEAVHKALAMLSEDQRTVLRPNPSNIQKERFTLAHEIGHLLIQPLCSYAFTCTLYTIA